MILISLCESITHSESDLKKKGEKINSLLQENVSQLFISELSMWGCITW